MDSSNVMLALSGVIVKVIANCFLGTHAPIDGTDIATVCTAFSKRWCSCTAPSKHEV